LTESPKIFKKSVCVAGWMAWLKGLPMTMISYAQDGEDVMLRRVFPEDRTGFYIDIGANDPVINSVTKHFYDRGWRGINVEPISDLCDRLHATRPYDINLNLGVSDRVGQLTFHESPDLPGWSTFSTELARSYRDRRMTLREYPIPVTTLAHICEEHVTGSIDFLKIDAEGFEREILTGNDWTRWRPKVVVVEDAWPDRWEHLLIDAGYVLAHRSKMNRFYTRVEDGPLAERLRPPLGSDDDFVRHRHTQVLVAMNHRFDAGEELSPAALRFALWLRRQAKKHPVLISVCEQVIRSVG